jgi:hypothetical protein
VRSTGSWRSSRHHPRCWKEIERETVIHASEAVAARSAVKACTVYIIMSRRSTAGISRQSIFHYNIYNLSSSVQCVCTSTISLPPCSVRVCAHTQRHTAPAPVGVCGAINQCARSVRLLQRLKLPDHRKHCPPVVFVILLNPRARTQVMK